MWSEELLCAFTNDLWVFLKTDNTVEFELLKQDAILQTLLWPIQVLDKDRVLCPLTMGTTEKMSPLGPLLCTTSHIYLIVKYVETIGGVEIKFCPYTTRASNSHLKAFIVALLKFKNRWEYYGGRRDYLMLLEGLVGGDDNATRISCYLLNKYVSMAICEFHGFNINVTCDCESIGILYDETFM